DAEDFEGRFDLIGTGERTTADLEVVSVTGQNNMGGVNVGQESDPDGGFVGLMNQGVQPVTISDIRIAPGLNASEFVLTRARSFVLQPGESQLVYGVFQPSTAGIRRAVLEIVSDDPVHPLMRIPLMGTGLVDGNLDYGNDFVAVESVFRELNNTPVLRTKSDAAGNWEFF